MYYTVCYVTLSILVYLKVDYSNQIICKRTFEYVYKLKCYKRKRNVSKSNFETKMKMLENFVKGNGGHSLFKFYYYSDIKREKETILYYELGSFDDKKKEKLKSNENWFSTYICFVFN